jgi:hypothetical protein
MLPKIYLVDVDGTLALKLQGAGTRGWMDWHRVQEDVPNLPVVQTVHALGRDYPIVCMTARDAVCREQTLHWLHFAGVYPMALLMRPQDDMRPDHEVKRELYEHHIRGVYEVIAVLEDRDAVVQMWREMGVTCFQVAPGNY